MPSSFAKPWLRGNRQQRFQIFHSKISLSHKNFLFGKILMMSFHVICGLGFPQSKILGTPMNWRSPKKTFLKTFFFGERLRLCPWPWPRAFLSLASSIPVLGLERFCPWKCCPWPWPRALCPRLHLWFLPLAVPKL